MIAINLPFFASSLVSPLFSLSPPSRLASLAAVSGFWGGRKLTVNCQIVCYRVSFSWAEISSLCHLPPATLSPWAERLKRRSDATGHEHDDTATHKTVIIAVKSNGKRETADKSDFGGILPYLSSSVVGTFLCSKNPSGVERMTEGGGGRRRRRRRR